MKEDKEKLPLHIKILIVSAFLMNAGTFMVSPFLVVYLSINLKFTPIEVGTIISANLICGRALPIVTGLLGDRISHRITLFIGIAIRAFGFIGYGVFTDFWGLVFASALTGIGGAFYDPSVTSIFATQDAKNRKRIFTYLNQALNAGAVLGPLFAALLLGIDATTPFIISGLVLVCIFVTLFMFNKQFITQTTTTNVLKSIKEIIGNKAYLKYISAMMLFWAMFAQLTISIPIHVFNITQSEKYISFIFIANGLTGLIFMFFLRKYFEKHEALNLIKIGMLICAASFILIPLTQSLVWLVLIIVMFTLGETLILPSSDMAVADYSQGNNPGGYFGLFEISFAGGTLIGNYVGMWLMEMNSIYPWIIYCGITCFTCWLISRLNTKQNVSSLKMGKETGV